MVLGLVTLSSAGLGMAASAAPRAPEPALLATPPAVCGPASRPETGIQGRVSTDDHVSGRAAAGFTCNTELIGSFALPDAQGTVGGYKVERYVDASGRECAYYDSTLLFPSNLVDGIVGVNVLDMSDPTHPVRTTSLITPAMLSPHESLVLSRERGLLAAVLGSPAFNVGVVDVYDISLDCRYPRLLASSPVGVLGHESGMAPDGRTFYSASPASATIVAVDLDNPLLPLPLWFGSYDSHGLSISDDGNRAYVAGVGSGLIILDISQVQARVPNPRVTEIARLQWESMSIPQNAIPVTIDGHPYVVEIDEFGTLSEVGAARIIDIGDERHPVVISNLRLAVHQPENFAAVAGDPGADGAIQGYAGHYCNVPQRTDPGIVACSMILSGLRVFDIRDPYHPREVAYFNAPVTPRAVLEASNYAMSSPAFAPERGEIWYTDGFSGFYAVRLTNGVWPFTDAQAPTSSTTLPEATTIADDGGDHRGNGGDGGSPAWSRRSSPAGDGRVGAGHVRVHHRARCGAARRVAQIVAFGAVRLAPISTGRRRATPGTGGRVRRPVRGATVVQQPDRRGGPRRPSARTAGCRPCARPRWCWAR